MMNKLLLNYLKTIQKVKRKGDLLKKLGALLICLFLITNPQPAKADMFGGDLIYLAQILANAIEQLAKTKEMLSNSKSNLELLKEVNQGISDSLGLARTIFPDIDPGTFNDWNKVSEAMMRLQQLYGIVTPSPDQKIYSNADRSVAEAISLNNSIYTYTKEIDQIGEAIKDASHLVSPKGAQKLTAESLGVMIHVMNQGLRAQATSLKLQAQTMAAQTKKDKDSTREYLSTATTLKLAMKSQKAQFQTPRF